MDEYVLQDNEVILYKGSANSESGKIGNVSDILLTNFNLVVIIRTKKLFQNEQIEVKTYPVIEIKVYDGIPQLKQKDHTVVIYFINSEVSLNFNSKIEMLKFVNVAHRLVTGKSVSQRGAAKFKGALNLVDDTLGIKTVDTIKKVLEHGVVGSFFGGIGKKEKEKETPKVNTTASNIAEVVGLAKTLMVDKTLINIGEKIVAPNKKSLDEQIDMLKKLKELVDAGILSEEEFNSKKKEILKI